MKTAKIKIEGRPQTGKSALAWLMKSALAQHGIACAITGWEDEHAGVTDETWKLRLAALKGQTVEVETIMARREMPNAQTSD